MTQDSEQEKREETLEDIANSVIHKTFELWDINTLSKLLFIPYVIAKKEWEEEDCDRDEKGGYLHLYTGTLYDDFGELQKRDLVGQAINSCYESVCKEMEEFLSLQHSALFYMGNYNPEGGTNPRFLRHIKYRTETDKPNLESYCKEHSFNFDEVKMERFLTENFKTMVLRYTLHAVNDELDLGIFLDETSEDLKGNIRDSYVPMEQAIQEVNEKGDESFWKMRESMRLSEEVRNRLGNILGKRLYEQHGTKLLPTLISIDPLEAIKFMNIISNSGEIDETFNVMKYFNEKDIKI